MSDFVHLHLHSEYSLLDGAARIKEIPKRAAECGHSAVALTDHGNMYGAVAFFSACREAGIKPIIGCEVYVAPSSRFEKSSGDGAYQHLVLLCQNGVGYKNLIYLVSKGFTDGFYSKPRVDDALLAEHSEGLIALSGCLAGRVARNLTKGDYDAAKAAALKYSKIFGKDNFYIELQDHDLPEQKQILPELVRIAKECSLPLVATNDCHYLRRGDADTQAIMMCIQTNSVITDGRPVGFSTDEFYYKTTEEMSALFGEYEGAIENTVKIAERCNFEFDFSKTYLPTYKCPNGMNSSELFRKMTFEGLARRVSSGEIDFSYGDEEEYRDRLDYELSVITEMGYADYFLIVQDYVNFAKSKKIPVGPGRGSGAGSLAAYCLGITDVDSIRFGLLFERFLNPERVSMPDIDIDFCYERRGEVLDYVAERYGSDHVSQIITFGTLAAKAAVRDVGRALGMSYGDVDVIAKAIPTELNITLEKAMRTKALRELYESSPDVRRLLDTAKSLEGMPRNISIHAAGVVITELPVSDYVPLAVSNGVTVTQFDMDTVAKLGLLKFDFLALRYLTIINDAQTQINEYDPDFDLNRLDLNDEKTYKLISSGNTLGVFQLESAGMRQMLTELKPSCIDDILAAIALYRPGPMESIPRFIECRRDPEKVKYPSPLLEPVLAPTFGCTVYQEQVMSVFRILAGYSYGHADIVRRAMSKKKASVLEAERGDFVAGATKNGMTESAANELFDDLGSFANYAFNKSHAAAYALISYRTAYLKAHYPKEYFAAMLTSVLGNPVKIAEYIAECNKAGIKVLPPDINESRMYFHVADGNIRFGLLALRNVGHQFVSALINERKRKPYSSFSDFAERMGGGELNKRMVESLIKSGAFDGLGVYRSRLLAGYEKLIDTLAERNRTNIAGQLDMFSLSFGGNDVKQPDFEFPNLPDLTLKEKLLLEKECSGMYFSGHLIDNFSLCAEAVKPTPIFDIISDFETDGGKFTDRQTVKLTGIVTSVSRKTTKNGDEMAFFKLEDRLGELECVVFSKQYARLSGYIYVDSALFVEGNLSYKDDEPPRVLVSNIALLIENSRYIPKPPLTHTDEKPKAEKPNPTPSPTPTAPKTGGKLYLKVPSMDSEQYKKCENLIEIFPGATPVVYFDASSKKYLARSGGIALSEFIMQTLKKYTGGENAIYK